ncbi:MAG: glycosyltransferase family 4 protein [Thermoleophilaceae bacterium]
MRVLLWSELFWPYVGGAELFAARLMLELRERGYRFLVVTSHDYLELPDEASYEGIPVHRLPFRPAMEARDAAALAIARRRAAAVKRAFAPDLVHVNALGPSVLFHLLTATPHRAPSLLRLQSEVLPSQADDGDTLLHRALVSADWIVGCSQEILDQARRVVPGITPRSSAIRGGVEVSAAPGGDRTGPPRLLGLGRLVPAKGFDVLLAAFADLAERFPELRLTIAGDGIARAELEDQASALGVAHAVDFTGWVEPDRVWELIGPATVVVMPSRREGLPQTALQAASMARPIVASRVGGLPEVVVDRESGMLVDPDDAPGLAEAIAFLLEHPEEAARMGLAARHRIRETMSLDRCVDAYDDLYRTLAPNSEWSP